MDACCSRIIDSIQNDIIGTDVGNRGMKPLIVQGDLNKACTSLANLKPNSVIVVMSGFPCCVNETPPTETDGPPGTSAIARACAALGHEVIVVTEACNEAVFAAAINDPLTSYPGDDLEEKASLQRRISLKVFTALKGDESNAEQEDLEKLANDADLIIACERAGPSSDGNCYTMRAISMNEKGLIAPLHRIVTLQKNKIGQKEPAPFIAIGDGGNELGMGKVLPQIINNPKIMNGNKIACVVPADFLIAASVSNWGGYALAAGAALIRAKNDIEIIESKRSSATDNYEKTNAQSEIVKEWIDRCLPSEADEIALLDRCVKVGCRDGVSGQIEATVDGMPLETSLKCLRDIRNLALSASTISI